MRQPSLPDDAEAIGQFSCFSPIVGHKNGGDLEMALMLFQFGPQMPGIALIQAAEGFVKKQNTRFGSDGSRQSRPLFFLRR